MAYLSFKSSSTTKSNQELSSATLKHPQDNQDPKMLHSSDFCLHARHLPQVAKEAGASTKGSESPKNGAEPFLWRLLFSQRLQNLAFDQAGWTFDPQSWHFLAITGSGERRLLIAAMKLARDTTGWIMRAVEGMAAEEWACWLATGMAGARAWAW